ncbi:MAG: RES family NAD+ phosphorylase [Bdellovibrionales bacterium]|nr:RES family NAD+ phosphorylase [Bdellovibrionales bacterium]
MKLFSVFKESLPSFSHAALSRFVTGNHTKSPLSVLGSQKVPGRFNIGHISPSQRSFGCLYLASDEATARAEKFLNPSQSGIGKLTPEEMYTAPIGPYLHSTVRVVLRNVLDLRQKESLKEFLGVVSKIKIPKIYLTRAKSLRIKPLPSPSRIWIRLCRLSLSKISHNGKP